MKFTTAPLTDRIGTEIKTDLDTLLSGSIVKDLRTLLAQRGVLLFRGIDMTDQQHLQFGKTLGTPRVELGGDIVTVTADRKRSRIFAEYAEGTYFFHSDDLYMDVPALGSIMCPRVLAPSGGQTEFCNTYAIYEDLPNSEKEYLDGLRAVHSQETIMRRAYPNPTDEQLAVWGEGVMPPKTHPLVWHHRSGRNSLLLANNLSRFVGMDQKQSDALLARLLALAEQPQYIYRHDWRLGDVLIWDNTGTMHRVVPFDLDCGRELRRVKLAGEEPIRGTRSLMPA